MQGGDGGEQSHISYALSIIPHPNDRHYDYRKLSTCMACRARLGVTGLPVQPCNVEKQQGL